jgi:hypothetical protein
LNFSSRLCYVIRRWGLCLLFLPWTSRWIHQLWQGMKNLHFSTRILKAIWLWNCLFCTLRAVEDSEYFLSGFYVNYELCQFCCAQSGLSKSSWPMGHPGWDVNQKVQIWIQPHLWGRNKTMNSKKCDSIDIFIVYSAMLAPLNGCLNSLAGS